jgi:sulfate transport system permease protein
MKGSSRVLPGFRLSLGLGVLYLSLIVLLPAITLVMQAAQIRWSELVFYFTDPRLLAAIRVTFFAAGCAAICNAVLGLWLAWILARYEFPGRKLADTLIDLPFALPTAVAGLTLSALFAQNGWIGKLLAPLGVEISFSIAGIVLAMTFTSLPFVVRSLQPVIEDLAPEYEEAAECLGANRLQIFVRVILPTLMPALSMGTALALVRSLGEFGAVIFIAGNRPFSTEVVSLMIYTYIGEYSYGAAAAVAFFLLLVSLLILLFVQLLQYRYRSKVNP